MVALVIDFHLPSLQAARSILLEIVRSLTSPLHIVVAGDVVVAAVVVAGVDVVVTALAAAASFLKPFVYSLPS